MAEKVLGGRLACQIGCCHSISELSNWKYQGKRISGVDVGLRNERENSYLNAILQCLTYTKSLLESLDSHIYEYPYPCHCGNQNFCVLRALRNHIQDALTTSSDSLSPDDFLDNLTYISTAFLSYQQEDAHDFLLAFLDKLKCCCLDQRRLSSQDTNTVDHVFGGRLISELRCCNCGFASVTFENSLEMSLEIQDADNITSALELFTRVETFEEQFTCDDCQKTVSKEKQYLLDKLPLVATFHLKRFGKNLQKISKPVNIPLELDLKPFLRECHHNEVSATNYLLYAFVEHVGTSLHTGHYISYVKSASKLWHKFDDDKDTIIHGDRVPIENSYILFYAREERKPEAKTEIFNPWNFRASLLHSLPKSVLESTDRECVSEISYRNKLCDSAGVTNPHVKTDIHCVSLSNETDEDVLLSTECSLEDSSMAKPRLDIDRVSNGDEPDHVLKEVQNEEPRLDTDEPDDLLKVQNRDSSPKLQDALLSTECSLEDSSMAKPRLDIDRITNGDEPDHVLKEVQNEEPRLDTDEPDDLLKVQNRDSSPKLQDALLSTECSLEDSSMAKPRLDIDRITNGDEPDDLFDVPADLFGHSLQVRVTKIAEKLKECRLEDAKEKWDANKQLQKVEQKKKRDEEKKRRDEVNKKKDKGRKKKNDKVPKDPKKVPKDPKKK